MAFIEVLARHKAASHCRTFYYGKNMTSSCNHYTNFMWDLSKLGCTLDKQNFTWLMCAYFN